MSKNSHRKTIMSTPPNRKIRLVRLAHVYYRYTDLRAASRFFSDFGLREVKRLTASGKETDVQYYDATKIYFRGYGTEPWVLCATKSDCSPRFNGAAFVVESEEDLRLASETLPGASKVYELKDAPGGGRCVTFHDPMDSWPMHFVYGQQSAEMLDIPQSCTSVNYVSFTFFFLRSLRVVSVYTYDRR